MAAVRSSLFFRRFIPYKGILMTTSSQYEPLSLARRLAIITFLVIGAFFSVRALTPNAAATSTTADFDQLSRRSAGEQFPADSAATSPPVQLVTKNIEDIQPGDMVLARDEHGRDIGLKPVKEVYRRTSYHLRHLTFEANDKTQQTLSTTDEHPFWSVTANKFVEAGSLPLDHQVTDQHGKTQTLISSRREEFPTGIAVFNLQVEDFHTYYVAAEADNDVLLVHNANDLYGVPIGSDLADAVGRGMSFRRGPGAPDEFMDQLTKMGRSEDRAWLGEQIHKAKKAANLGAAEDLIFDLSGGVWDSRTGEFLEKIWNF